MTTEIHHLTQIFNAEMRASHRPMMCPEIHLPEVHRRLAPGPCISSLVQVTPLLLHTTTGTGEMCPATGACAGLLIQGRRSDEDTEGACSTFSTMGDGAAYPHWRRRDTLTARCSCCLPNWNRQGVPNRHLPVRRPMVAQTQCTHPQAQVQRNMTCAGAAFSPGLSDTYLTTCVGAAATASAGEMCSTTGVGATFTAGAGAGRAP